MHGDNRMLTVNSSGSVVVRTELTLISHSA
jgi:hypothetical protein